MGNENRNRRPGDVILDRYMPSATVEEREGARENLRKLARVLIEICDRLARERSAQSIRANGDGAIDSS